MDDRVFTLRDIVDIWTKYPCEYKENRCDDSSSLFICKLGQPWCNIHTCPLIFNSSTGRFEKYKKEELMFDTIGFYKALWDLENEMYQIGTYHIIKLNDLYKEKLFDNDFFSAVQTTKNKVCANKAVLVRHTVELDGLNRKVYFDNLVNLRDDEFIKSLVAQLDSREFNLITFYNR